jgi:hypothetical protein
MSMHFKFMTAGVAIALDICVGLPPRGVFAAAETNRSSAKGKPGGARTVRQQLQPETPPSAIV